MTRLFTKIKAYGIFHKNELLSLHLKRKFAQNEIIALESLDIDPKIIKVMIVY